MPSTLELKSNTDNLSAFPKYNYGSFIDSTSELGVTSEVGDGNGINQISKNMGALIDYIDNVLITGNGSGNKGYSLSDPNLGNHPLGNAYFYSSGLNCIDPDTKKSIPAYMYMNNVPLGNIPLISSLAGGKDFQNLRGLIPGMFEDLEGFDPNEFLAALEIGEQSQCVYPELPVTNISKDGNKYNDDNNGLPRTYYENDPDSNTKKSRPMFKSYAKLIDPCLFKLQENKHTNPPKQCNEPFSNINPLPLNNLLPSNNSSPLNNKGNLPFQMSDDVLIQIYFIAVAILFLFILLKMLHK